MALPPADAEPSLEPFDHAAHVEGLQSGLDYRFRNPDLLLRALTHRSFANESEADQDNQRLEYLGDAVLDLIISHALFTRHPTLPEGQLSYLRSRLVCEEALAAQAEALDLGAYLLLGRGEERSGGRTKPSLLADAFEAVLAAVFLDGGFDAAVRVVLNRFDSVLHDADSWQEAGDHKTRLQELIQARRDERPRYTITDADGPPHARTYTAVVYVGDKLLGTGSGPSKKAAQQSAARDALDRLER